jgi:hypothetical protein
MRVVWTLADFLQWTGCFHLHHAIRLSRRRRRETGSEGIQREHRMDVEKGPLVSVPGVLCTIFELAKLWCAV